MSVETSELNVHLYEDGYVRGLPTEIGSTMTTLQQPWDKVNRWYRCRDVSDVEAELSLRGINFRPHRGMPGAPPVNSRLDAEAAEKMFDELLLVHDRIESGRRRWVHIGVEFIKGKGWLAMGYATLDALLLDRRPPFVLPKQARKELVAQALEEGLSLRLAASLAGTSRETARRDAQELSGDTYVSPAPAAGDTYVSPVPAAPQELRRYGQDGKSYPVGRNRPEPEPITGRVLPFPEPEPEPDTPQSADDAAQALIERLEAGAPVSTFYISRLRRLFEYAEFRNAQG